MSEQQTIHFTIMLEDGRLVQDTAVFIADPRHDHYPLEVISLTRDLEEFGDEDWRPLHVALTRKLINMGARQPFTQFSYECVLDAPSPTKIVVNVIGKLIEKSK